MSEEVSPRDEQLGESKEESKQLRELGPQPIAVLMDQFHLKSHDLVVASTEQLTHKMVARAMKGRRLTSNTKGIVQRAFNKAAKGNFTFSQLFNY